MDRSGKQSSILKNPTDSVRGVSSLSDLKFPMHEELFKKHEVSLFESNLLRTKFPVTIDPSRVQSSILNPADNLLWVSGFSDLQFPMYQALLNSSKANKETPSLSSKKRDMCHKESLPSKKLKTGFKTAKEPKKPRKAEVGQDEKASCQITDAMSAEEEEKCFTEMNYDNIFEKMEPVERLENNCGRYTTVDREHDDVAKGQIEKVMLLRLFNQAMIKMPNFLSKEDQYRGQLLSLLDKCPDPEFVMKVSLYGRKHLNVRTASNFLLAYAAMNDRCKPFLTKYYSAIVILPSDWLEIAELALTLCKDKIVFPTSLRKPMTKKFVDFDKYQLAKYNKDKAANRRRREKKKMEKQKDNQEAKQVEAGPVSKRGRYAKRGSASTQSEREAQKEGIKKGLEFSVPHFTIKQMIRKLHISEPVDNVMCLIGKKYPSDMDAFFRSRLPGLFEEEKAGKRMKLPIPETWETELSLKGNKAKVWEKLIDDKKLPFMAMLRNLRNLILVNISAKHHQSVIGKLTSENAVINSKQFPFRFFSAYSVLDKLEVNKPKRLTVRKVVRPKKKSTREIKSDQQRHDLISKYKAALDKAVKISSTYNIPPLSGRTIVLCDVSDSDTNDSRCSSAKGLGEARTIGEMAVLLSLLCKHSCEDGRLLVCGSDTFEEVQLSHKDSILENTKSVLRLEEAVNDYRGDMSYLVRLVDDIMNKKEKIDRWIVIGGDSQMPEFLNKLLPAYTEQVPWDLKAFIINLGNNKADESGDSTREPNESDDFVHISGFSDQVLRFIAEEGDKGQLTFVENVDKLHKLEDTKHLLKLKRHRVEVPTEICDDSLLRVPRWSNCRIFISSTFLDMFSERDLLVKYIFQELKVRARSLQVNIFDVDLRWGISEEQTQNNQTIQLCLSEVSKCQFFVGMLGERYGWCPGDYEGLARCPGLEWVEKHPRGASLTELEFKQCFRSLDIKNRAFFYFRDSKFLSDVPKKYKHLLNDDNAQKLRSLKKYVMNSGAEVYENYPCCWGGVGEDGKARVTNLEEFGKRVLDNLWNAIKKVYSKDDDDDDDDMNEGDNDEVRKVGSQHLSYVDFLESRFVGRQKLVKSIINTMATKKRGLLLVTGKPGSGKSALVASVFKEWIKSTGAAWKSVIHCIGSSPGSDDVIEMLTRLVSEVDLGCRLKNATYDIVCKVFNDILHNYSLDTSDNNNRPIAIFVDGVDRLLDKHQARLMAWLPHNIPEKVLFIVSTNEDSEPHRALRHRPSLAGTFELGTLNLSEKQDIIRGLLKDYSKSLDESAFNNQMKFITSKRDSSSPLYLSLVCEEMRQFGDFEMVSSKLFSTPPTIPKLLLEIIAKLEQSHGELLARTALCCLACAKDGLKEFELQELITRALLVQSWAEVTKFDDVIGKVTNFDLFISPSSLLFFLRGAQSLLSPNSEEGLIRITSREVLEALQQRYTSTLLGKKYERFIHMLIASYFYCAVDPNGDMSWKAMDKRSLSSLLHHLVQSSCYDVLSKVLTNLVLILHAFRLKLSKELKEAYLVSSPTNVTLKKDYDDSIGSKKFQEYRAFVDKNEHILMMHPQSTFQQALADPDDSDVYVDAEQFLLERPTCRMPCARWINKQHFRDLCVQTVEAKDASCLALNSDDKILAVGFETAIIKTYSTSSYEITSTLIGHSSSISSLCFVSNVRLCSASRDGTLSLWDIVNGFRITVMEGHGRPVTSCTSDVIGRIIVSVGLDAQIKVWHGVTGASEDTVARDTRPINCLALHPEGKLLVVGSWDFTLKIWDYIQKDRKAILRGHSGSVQGVKFNQSGIHIASVDIFGEVRIWSSQYGCTVGLLKNQSFTGVFYSPNYGELLTSTSNGTVKVMSPTLGRCTTVFEDPNQAICLNFDHFSESLMPDFAVGYHSGSVKMFSSATGSMVWEKIYKGPPVASSCIVFHKDKDLKFLVVGKADGNCEILATSGDDKRIITTLVGHASPVTGICSVGDCIITSGGKTLHEHRLCDLSKSNIGSPNKPSRARDEHEGTIMAIAKGNNYLASVGRDRMIIIWSTDSLEVENKIKEAHRDWITCCSWSSQNDHLVTGSNDFVLKIWDALKGNVKYTLEGHMSMVTGVAYRHGCIVSSSSNGSLRVWSHRGVYLSSLKATNIKCNSCDLFVGIKKAEEEQENGYNWHIRTIIKEAKGEKSKELETTIVMAASCHDDGTVRIWNPIEADEKHVLVGHKGDVKAVIAGRNGLVCTTSSDGFLKSWKIPTVQEVPKGSTTESSSAVSCLVLSPSGEIICGGTRSGALKFWLRSEISSSFDVLGGSKCRVRVSMKQVTNLRFVSDAILAVSSDDLELSVWRVISNGDDLSLSCLNSVSTDRPVTCMASFRDDSDNYLVTIQLQGLLQMWKVEGMNVVFEQQSGGKSDDARSPVFHGDHIVVDDNRIKFFALKHKSFQSYSYEIVKSTQSQARTLCLTSTNSVGSTRTMTSFAYNDLLFFGSTDGFVDVRNVCDEFKNHGVYAVHADEITSMLCDGDVLFTCSRDGYVKAFDTKQFVVIGQFSTPFILTSMVKVNIDTGRPWSTKLVCGTESGIIVGLEWIIRK